MLTTHARCALLVGSALLPCCATPEVAASSERPGRSQVPDAVTSNPDEYTVVFENDRVRVLDYHDEPGQRTVMHHHPDFVLLVVAPFERRITLPDGSSRERAFRAGEVLSMKAETHIGENIGATATHALLVEFK
jgi:quercetin dioxygenase-like cupin family protein